MYGGVTSIYKIETWTEWLLVCHWISVVIVVHAGEIGYCQEGAFFEQDCCVAIVVPYVDLIEKEIWIG